MLPFFISARRVVVIDCATSRTALGVFSRRGGRLCLVDLAVEAFPVTVGDEDGWLKNTRSALHALRARVKISGPVVLVLPAHLVLTKLIKTPRVDPAKREKVIRFEAEQNIPLALTDVVWGGAVVSETAGESEVLLCAAKLAAVNLLCAAVGSAGFEPCLILPAPLTTLAAFRLTHPVRTDCPLVLNVGARSTLLLLAGPDRFFFRTLPFGGNSITQQIGVNRVSDPVDTFANRLAQEITRSVLHFRRHGDVVLAERVHLTGGGARFPGLDVALAAKLKMPVGLLDVVRRIEITGEVAKSDGVAFAPPLTDLIGAAATQLQTGHPVLNLLPPGLRGQEDFRRRQRWLIAAAALAVAALLPPVVHFRQLGDEAGRKTVAIEAELAPLREREARNRVNLTQLEELKSKVARLEEVQARRTSWLALLADLQERLVRAEDVWLESLSPNQTDPGAPLRLQVSGRMLDSANPVARVSRDTNNRVKALLSDLDRSPYARVAEEGQRFDPNQSGILKFDFVLVADRANPL